MSRILKRISTLLVALLVMVMVVPSAMPHLAASVHGGEPAGMDVHDVAGQRLVARPHAADGPWPEHAVAARREETAVQRFGQDLAIGPALKRFPYSSMHAAINAVSGRARPRRKPEPSSISLSPGAIPCSPPAAASAPPSPPARTASSPTNTTTWTPPAT